MSSWVVLGSGNVATQFARMLSQHKQKIMQVYSPNLTRAKELAKLHPTAEATQHIENIHKTADYYLIAVSDNAIVDIAEQLTEDLTGTVLHTSGATDIQVLEKFSRYGVLYPLQTIHKNQEVDFASLPLAVEGSDSTITKELLALVKPISKHVYQYSSKQRLAAHVAAIFVNNFTNSLFQVAYDILKEQDMPFEIVYPLIEKTAKAALNSTPKDVQTGPAARNDNQTIQKHLDFLKGNIERERLYRILTEEIKKQQNKPTKI